MAYQSLCSRMFTAGWLSHPVAASQFWYHHKREPHGDIDMEELERLLRLTKTFSTFDQKAQKPSFNESRAVPVMLQYPGAGGDRPDRGLLDEETGLLMCVHPKKNRKLLGFAGDFPAPCLLPEINGAHATEPPAIRKELSASSSLIVGHSYTRRDLYNLLDVPANQQGGDWDTGYHRHGLEWFIFPTVAGRSRTGHDYDNRWENGRFVWRGRNGSLMSHPSIQDLSKPGGIVHLFTREHDRDPFVYVGLVEAVDIRNTSPVTVVWQPIGMPSDNCAPEEVLPIVLYREGTVHQIMVNAYERNNAARRTCIAHWGTNCAVCNFDFGETYGPRGEGFIHVHHLRPLVEIGETYEVDPITDLRPVCPNCHAMLHRGELLSIEELQELLQESVRQVKP
ncbi:MAG: DUF3427 domain-containing protein [Verrucomicrobiaceae bacterium]|nr:MAG: DUF3427 domain-containing protein [Verrucomicrobiaceae bacterium]